MLIKRLLLVSLFSVSTFLGYAQNDDELVFPLEDFYAKRVGYPIRTVLSKFTFSLTTGYGRTFVHNKLDDFGIYQAPGGPPRLFPNGSTTSPLLSNWFNRITVDSTTVVVPGYFRVASDTTELGFKGKAINIPFNASLHYSFDRYRIGGGFALEYMGFGELSPTQFQNQIANFAYNSTTVNGMIRKYYGLLGISFYQFKRFLFTGDAQIGGYGFGKKFDKPQIKTGVYVNVGITAEYQLSEYISAIARPSFEFKNYVIEVPETGQSMAHYLNALYVHVGLSYRFPRLPRCYNKDCKIQIDHAHGNKEYRSREHPFYKKQNPMYGENYPKLIKYKDRNRKKLNPY